mmetsp:Transcript_27579/g.80537  ORF Transcript_27579/g.80537 Transcript_27579/m.80537 type:complete len:121 (-) Transcript_27579:89-451(-)
MAIRASLSREATTVAKVGREDGGRAKEGDDSSSPASRSLNEEALAALPPFLATPRIWLGPWWSEVEKMTGPRPKSTPNTDLWPPRGSAEQKQQQQRESKMIPNKTAVTMALAVPGEVSSS